jgi:hypothetical protein
MSESKKGRQKKYIHEIKVNFDAFKLNDSLNSVDLNRLCDELSRREQTYLNPQFISR